MNIPIRIVLRIVHSYIFIALLLLPRNRVFLLLSGPKTTVAMVGTNVTLYCNTTSDSPYWIWHFYNSRIVDGNGCHLSTYTLKSKFSPKVINRQECNLMILNVALSDAGMYSCSDTNDILLKGVAHLIVIGKELNCSSSQPSEKIARYEDMVVLSCSLEFNDTTISNMPQLSWNLNGSESTTYFSHPNMVVNQLEKKIDELVETISPVVQSQICTMHMARFPLPVEFKSTCKTDPIVVFYPPGSVKIVIPHSGIVHTGDVIACIANSNPSSIYHWQSIQNSSISGQLLAVHESGTYSCTAQNVINGKIYNRTVTARIYVDDSLSTATTVFITIVVTSIALVILYATVFCINVDFKTSVIL